MRPDCVSGLSALRWLGGHDAHKDDEDEIRARDGAAATVVLAGCDWAQLGYGPDGTNFNPSEPALTASSVAHLNVAWSASCACSLSRPLVAGGTVFAIDGATTAQQFPLMLRAFNASTGTARWSTPLGLATFGSALVAVGNGLVYLTVRPPSGSDRLVAIDAATGAVRWQITPTPPGTGPVFIGLPVVDGPLVFLTATASDSSQLFAIDATGHTVWSAVPGGKVWPAAPLAAVPGKTIYVASQIQASDSIVSLLRGYSESDGTATTTAIVPNALPIESLATANGLVYGTWFTDFGRDSSVGAFALHPDTGALAWSGDLFTLAVTPKLVLTNNPRGGTLDARNPTTGAVVWSTTETDPSGAATDQLVVFAQGMIRRLSDGAVVGNVPSPASDPVLSAVPSNGRIFATSAAKITAFAPATS